MSGEICTCPDPAPSEGPGTPVVLPGKAHRRGCPVVQHIFDMQDPHTVTPEVPDGYEAVWLPSETVDEFDAGEDDRVSRGHVVAGAREAQARRGTTPAPPPAPSPVPPWPGAVLSGLTDEDGVPTWLAQAGDVRGEAVRGRVDHGWGVNDYIDTVWVEVRAPRAVPEPETERVPWWEAVGREVFDQDGERVTIEHVQCGDGAGPSVTAYNAAKRRDTSLLRVPITVRGDGTVEVLKDGDR